MTLELLGSFLERFVKQEMAVSYIEEPRSPLIGISRGEAELSLASAVQRRYMITLI
jgi:hypothetical protein